MTSKTKGEEKLTLEEFRELFGDEIPIEVVKFGLMYQTHQAGSA